MLNIQDSVCKLEKNTVNFRLNIKQVINLDNHAKCGERHEAHYSVAGICLNVYAAKRINGHKPETATLLLWQ